LGSVTNLTDASGNVASQYEYDAYGEVLAATGSTSQQPFGYLGNETDPTTTQATNSSSSLDDFNAREYDPSLGEFLSSDPVPGILNMPQTLAHYLYGADNPFSNPDKTGLCFLGVGAGCFLTNTVANGFYALGSVAGLSKRQVATGALDAVNVVHQVAGGVAFVAGICALVTSETVIGGATCGAIALAAESVNVATGAILLEEGQESGVHFAFDVAGLALGGAGYGLEDSATTFGLASDIADARSASYATNALFGPVESFLPNALAASDWGVMADQLSQTASKLTGLGYGLNALDLSGDLLNRFAVN
jgi:RHS repeat-associated protein